ncbi:hypothetical protein [uncultured Bradyrhizobium sp.]|uniref:hypothetical protein n=1 Tax=Bradyrhizobium sp. TaxID=376 RepID=UPI0026341171|nr:hypothetical protein [uncultured Bradyrhizobium sp.]
MSTPTVVMQPPTGTFPTLVHLPDGTVGKMLPADPNNPAASNRFEIPARFIGVLIAAGWTTVV